MTSRDTNAHTPWAIRPAQPDDADALRLWKSQERDLAVRYDDPDLVLETVFPTLVGSWVGEEGNAPVATLVARWSPYAETRPGDLELKRLWVEPTHRGRGYSKAMMRSAEEAARRAGATRLILETGAKQPEANALYASMDYHRMDNYGEYAHEPDSMCWAKDLPTRVLVINGTMGAGKSTTAAAVHDLLIERGARSAWIDADALCQASPAAPDDPFRQRLLFEALEGAAGAYRNHGIGLIVVARVVEDAADRGRYAAIFGTADAGPASVAIVRVSAGEAERMARLRTREPEGVWQNFAFARTVELEASLEALNVDDAVVATDASDRLEVAQEVLDVAGW